MLERAIKENIKRLKKQHFGGRGLIQILTQMVAIRRVEEDFGIDRWFYYADL